MILCYISLESNPLLVVKYLVLLSLSFFLINFTEKNSVDATEVSPEQNSSSFYLNLDFLPVV